MPDVARLKTEEQHWQQRLIEVQEACGDAQQDLVRLQTAGKEYEAAQQIIRDNDKKRTADLEDREQKLKAGWRALNEEKQALAEDKKRFYETRDLHS